MIYGGSCQFYIPRSNPDGCDVNVRCLDPMPVALEIEPFDGKNWEEHAHELAHMSKETQQKQGERLRA